MKLLLDSGVGKTARRILEEAGFEVESVRDWDIDPGDEEILARAHGEGRIVITIDKDFGALAALHGQPHSGIVRIVQMPVLKQADMCLIALQKHGEGLLQGAIVTVEVSRIRFRAPRV